MYNLIYEMGKNSIDLNDTVIDRDRHDFFQILRYSDDVPSKYRSLKSFPVSPFFGGCLCDLYYHIGSFNRDLFWSLFDEMVKNPENFANNYLSEFKFFEESKHNYYEKDYKQSRKDILCEFVCTLLYANMYLCMKNDFFNSEAHVFLHKDQLKYQLMDELGISLEQDIDDSLAQKICCKIYEDSGIINSVISSKLSAPVYHFADGQFVGKTGNDVFNQFCDELEKFAFTDFCSRNALPDFSKLSIYSLQDIFSEIRNIDQHFDYSKVFLSKLSKLKPEIFAPFYSIFSLEKMSPQNLLGTDFEDMSKRLSVESSDVLFDKKDSLQKLDTMVEETVKSAFQLPHDNDLLLKKLQYFMKKNNEDDMQALKSDGYSSENESLGAKVSDVTKEMYLLYNFNRLAHNTEINYKAIARKYFPYSNDIVYGDVFKIFQKYFEQGKRWNDVIKTARDDKQSEEYKDLKHFIPLFDDNNLDFEHRKLFGIATFFVQQQQAFFECKSLMARSLYIRMKQDASTFNKLPWELTNEEKKIFQQNYGYLVEYDFDRSRSMLVMECFSNELAEDSQFSVHLCGAGIPNLLLQDMDKEKNSQRDLADMLQQSSVIQPEKLNNRPLNLKK